MRFTIDVVFLDRSQRVTRVHRGLRPWRWALGGNSARAALELAEGGARGVAPGDQLKFDWD